MTKQEFAEMVKVHKQTIENITNRRHKSLRTDVCEKIVAGTKGKVTYEDLIKELKGIPPTYPLDQDVESPLNEIKDQPTDQVKDPESGVDKTKNKSE
jgi:hypothetical protein